MASERKGMEGDRQPDGLAIAEEACAAARRAQMLARAALIIACMSIAVAILGMFLPIG